MGLEWQKYLVAIHKSGSEGREANRIIKHGTPTMGGVLSSKLS